MLLFFTTELTPNLCKLYYNYVLNPKGPRMKHLGKSTVCLSSVAGDLGNASEAWGRLSLGLL